MDSALPLGGVWIKSIIFVTVLLALVSGLILLYTRQCKLNITFKDVVARFGAFLTVPAAILVVALLTALLKLVTITIFLSGFGIMGLMVAISLTIYSYRKNLDQGIDALYGILFTFLDHGHIRRIFGVEIISSLVYTFIDPFGIIRS